jgi:hypothetical protein
MSYGVALRNGVPFTLGTIAALCTNATGSAWTPTDLASLGAWFDPSDLSTMFQDAAGTTPVTAAGQPVGLILDKSGNGYHASQATSTARPLFQIDGSGKHYLAFDGVDDYLSTAAIDLTGTSKVTVISGTLDTTTSLSILYETSANAIGGGAFFCAVDYNSGGVSDWLVSGNAAIAFTTVADQTARAVTTAEMSSVFTAGVGALSVNVNGSAQTLENVYNPTGTSTGNFGNHPLFIGARSGPSLPFNGNLYSFILGATNYDAATVLAAETWVAGKTGVTL